MFWNAHLPEESSSKCVYWSQVGVFNCSHRTLTDTSQVRNLNADRLLPQELDPGLSDLEARFRAHHLSSISTRERSVMSDVGGLSLQYL